MMNNQVRQFDLNIERVLEHWTVAHALREVIANALDEQALTSTAEPAIFKDSQGAWHIKYPGQNLYGSRRYYYQQNSQTRFYRYCDAARLDLPIIASRYERNGSRPRQCE